MSPAASWLAGYLRIDSSNPPGREAAAADYLAGLLRTRGFAVSRYVTPSGRTSVAARLDATVEGAPDVVLLHHLDVVPAGADWSEPPFAGEVRAGALIGRGAIDDKSLGIAHLAAFLEAARLPERRRGLVLLAVADEESGGGEGTAWLLEHHPELFGRVAIVLGEGGMNRTVLGRTLFWGVEVAQKRALWLELTAKGRPSHGSSLNPDSATHQLVLGLAKVLERPPRWHLGAAVARFLQSLGRFDPGFAPFVENPGAVLGPNGPTAALPPAFASLLEDTLQVTVLEGSDRINVVAPEARARLDVRLLNDTDENAYLADLASTLGSRIATRVLLEPGPPTPASPDSGADWELFGRVLADGHPLVPAVIPGITDSRYFRQRGIAAYGVSPFELEALDLRRVHGPDERIPLAAFDAGVKRMKRLVAALVTSAGPR